MCRFVVRVRFASNALRCFFVTGLRSTTTDADDTDADANADAAAAAAVEGADGLSQSATEARSAAAVGMSLPPCALLVDTEKRIGWNTIEWPQPTHIGFVAAVNRGVSARVT